MRIGLFGGSFNPPHHGHLHISNLALKKLGLNQIWWIPTAHNPFKDKNIYASYSERYEKCKKISNTHPKIRLKKFDEIYTAHLVKKLQKKYPRYEFIWIMGADNLPRFHQWDHFKNLIKMLPIAIFSRDDFLPKIYRTKSFTIYKKMISPDKSLPKFKIFPTQKLKISSTELRNNA